MFLSGTLRTEILLLIVQNLNFVKSYKYLGVLFDEHLEFKQCEQTLTDSASRALGNIIAKLKGIKNMGCKTYTKLYENCVLPIMGYGSAIWAYGNTKGSQVVQNRAIRSFLGVHKYAANAAINGDMGWINCATRQKIEMVRYWNRLCEMDNNRLTKHIFLWDYGKNMNNWSNCIKSVLIECNMNDHFINQQSCNLNHVKEKLLLLNVNTWKEEVSQKPKLEFYKTVKHEYLCEKYVYENLDRDIRSCVAQLCAGILPFEVEIGRFSNTPRDQRICKLCTCNTIENENHFLFECPLYINSRAKLSENIVKYCTNYNNLEINEKLSILFEHPYYLGKYLKESLYIRQCKLYN